MDDVDLLRAEVLGPHRADGTLQVVRGDDAGVVALAIRVIGVRLVRLTLARLGQAGIRVGRRDHDEARLVEERDRHLRRARVVRPDVGDDGFVVDRLARVLGLLRRVPRPLGRGRVVKRLEVHRDVVDLRVGDRHLDRVDDLDRLRPRGAGHRQARHDLDGLRARGAAATRASTTCADHQRKDGDDCGCGRPTLLHARPPWFALSVRAGPPLAFPTRRRRIFRGSVRGAAPCVNEGLPALGTLRK